MDQERAYEIFDLDESATEDEIEQRFRDIVNEEHPDKGGESIDISEIVEARDVAIDNVEKGLTNYQEPAAPSIYDREYERRKEQTQKEVSRIKRKHTSKYRRFKQLTKITGGFFGVLSIMNFLVTLFDVQSMSGSLPFLFVANSSVFIDMIFYMAISIGLMHYILIVKIRNIELIIEEAEEALDRKPTLIRTISEMGSYNHNNQMSDEELEDSMNKWISDHGYISPINSMFGVLSVNLDLQTIAVQMGPRDFKRLFIRKCVESNILEEDVNLEEGEPNITYTIKES